jgi:hypothetical protein
VQRKQQDVPLAASSSACINSNFLVPYVIKYYVMKRDKVMDAIKEFPKEFELDDLIEKLVFVEKVEKGLQQLKKGKTATHGKVKEIVKKW